MAVKLQIRNLYKVFGNHPQEALELLEAGRSKEEILAETGSTIGVQDVNVEIERGSIFVVMGLSGSGKSTLIRLLNGLIPPTSGQVLIDGEDVAAARGKALRAIRRDKIAMVFQHFALFPHRTVLENAAYGLKVKGLGRSERNERALRALDQVGLQAYANSYPDELSGGMQQRVGLARGLASEPEILLMDEPFGALDPLIRRDMQEELIQLQRKLHKTIVFITHDLNEALILGDKIAIMKEGRFVQVGTAEDIVANPADDYVSAFTQDIDRSRVFTARRVSKAPEALDHEGVSAEQAIERMKASGRDFLFLTRHGRPIGLLSYRDLASESGPAAAYLCSDFPTTTPRTQLNDLYATAGEGRAIAVVDEEGYLVGVVEPSDIFRELGETGFDLQPTASSGTPAAAA